MHFHANNRGAGGLGCLVSLKITQNIGGTILADWRFCFTLFVVPSRYPFYAHVCTRAQSPSEPVPRFGCTL